MIMKVIKTENIVYECGVCGAQSAKEDDALACESVLVKHDKCVKVSDKVKILCGSGKDEIVKVSEIGIVKGNCDGREQRYKHTVYVVGVFPCYQVRFLFWDQYEIV